MTIAIPYSHNPVCPSTSYNFATATAIPSWITHSRGSHATYFDSNSNLNYAPNNLITNNSMSGTSSDPELISNTLTPGAGLGITGWTGTQFNGSNGTITPNGGGGLTFTNTNATGSLQASIPITVQSGVSYMFTATQTTPTNINMYVASAIGSGADIAGSGFQIVGAATSSLQWTSAITGTVYIAFSVGSSIVRTITNVSVHKTLVTNGDFVLNPINASQNTIQNGWQWSIAGGTATVTYSSSPSQVTLTGDGTNSAYIDQQLTTVTGVTYNLIFDNINGSNIGVLVGTVQGSSSLLNSSTNNLGGGSGTFTFQFTATGTTTWIRFYRTLASGAILDNVRIYASGNLPTNWSIGSLSGLSSSVVGTGTLSQGTYTDIRLYGTTTSSGTAYIIFHPNSSIASLYGQSWILSSYLSLSSGSLTNIGDLYLAIGMANSSGTFLNLLRSSTLSPTSVLSNYQTGNKVINQSTAAYVYPSLNIQLNSSGLAVDVTFRIILPQLSLVTAAQTIIPDMSSTSSSAYYGPRLDNQPAYASSNVLLQSDDQTISPWGTNAGTSSKDGTLSLTGKQAVLLLDNATNTEHYVQETVTGIQVVQPLMYVGYFKQATGRYVNLELFDNSNFTNFATVTYDLQTAGTSTLVSGQSTLINYGISHVGNGWYQAWLCTQLATTYNTGILVRIRTASSLGTTSGAVSYSGTGTGIYIGGTQVQPVTLVQANTPPVYSATTTSAVTPSYPYQQNNAIRNNSMNGVVAGTPGTLPTNISWNTNTLNNLSTSVIGSGTSNGISYTDVRLYGTTSGGTFTNLSLESVGAISALNNQTWALSLYSAIVAGSTSNLLTITYGAAVYSSTSAYVGEITAVRQDFRSTLSKSLNRISTVGSTPSYNTGSILPYIQFTYSGTGSVNIDITLRIGLHQCSLIAAGQTPFGDLPVTTGTAYNTPPSFAYQSMGLLLEGTRTNYIRNNTAQGVVLGDSQLISNSLIPGAGAGITGWIAGVGSAGTIVANASGGIDITGTGTGYTGAYIPITVQSGVSYMITYTVATNAVNVSIGSTTNVGTFDIAYTGNSTAAGTTTSLQWTSAVTGTVYVHIWRASAATSTVTNISVIKTYVTNGDLALTTFGTGSGGAYQNGWKYIISGTSSASYSTNLITMAGDGTNGTYVYMSPVTTVAGVSYTLQLDIGSNNIIIQIGTTDGGNDILTYNNVGPVIGGAFRFTATTTTTYFRFVRIPTGNATIANARVTMSGGNPTNWFTATTTGLSSSIIASGYNNGVPYIRMRCFGTTTAINDSLTVVFDTAASLLPATTGQFVNISGYFALNAGTIGGSSGTVGSSYIGIYEYNSSSTFLQSDVARIINPSSSILTRNGITITLSNASAAYVGSPQLYIQFPTSGTVVDFTIDIALPQLEFLSSASQTASSVMPTYGSAGAPRSADIATITGVPATILTSSQGTALVETTLYVSADTAIDQKVIGSTVGYALFSYHGAGIGYAATYNGTNSITTASAPPWTTGARAAVAWNGSGRAVDATNQAVVKDTNSFGTSGSYWLGSQAGILTADGWYSRAAFWANRLSDTMLSDKVKMNAPL